VTRKVSTKVQAGPRNPFSWGLDTWKEIAPDFWPGNGDQGRWVVRAYRDELIECGAISRVGKKIIVFGAGYTRWLARRTSRVKEFTSNNPAMRVGAKLIGRGKAERAQP
jgi:hypothetical protein